MGLALYEFAIVFVVVGVSGLLTALSRMSVSVEKLSHVRLSTNDMYMALLMASWALLGLGVVYRHITVVVAGLIGITVCLMLIRKQMWVNAKQYILGMIPHHSTAVFWTRKIIDKGYTRYDNHLDQLAKNIMETSRWNIDVLLMMLKGYTGLDIS